MPTIDATRSLQILLDALDGELSPESKTALAAQMELINPPGVKPGDLITAELFNDMSDKLEDLLDRVAALEGSSSASRPVITGFDPTIVRTGTQFAVLGDHLESQFMQEIRIENTLVPVSQIKAGSTRTRMLLDAPAIIGLPNAGGPVILTLTNSAGNAQGTYTQLPGIAANIQANVAFVPRGLVPSEAIQANKAYDVNIRLNIHSSHDETFDFSAAFDANGWQVNSVNPPSATVTSASASAGQIVDVVVKVRTGAAGTGNLTLRVKGHNFTAFEQAMVPALKMEIAQTTQLPSDKIKFNNISVLSPHGWNGADPTVMIHRTSIGTPSAALNVLTQLDLVDSFNLTNLVCSPAADWTAAFISSASFSANQVGASQLIQLQITPKKDATQFTAADGTISFQVANQNGLEKRIFSAKLRVLS